MLWNFEEAVVDNIKKIRRSGATANRSITIAAARGII